ncbi:adenylate kinase [Salibacterium salarium]|uniref:Adenylate kinase n=1 Tax=Salibacterium salarium TaxID=284579 RepID=A0A428MSL2_9BACI|nr:AAA family ATPase [Salibacterium salarium]RSL29131.1 adenylate kinase [Salibacterium salarium]
MSEITGIALTGQMRSGKDTIATYAAEEYGFMRFAFGDALKRLAHEIYPWVPAEPKPRGLYQHMNVMRDYDPAVWVRHCFADISETEHERDIRFMPYVPPIITDARQQNEIDACRARGYVIIEVFADESARIERMESAGETFNPAQLQHATERHIGEFAADYTIDNSGKQADAFAQFDEIMRRVRA